MKKARKGKESIPCFMFKIYFISVELEVTRFTCRKSSCWIILWICLVLCCFPSIRVVFKCPKSQAIPEPNPRQCALGYLWCCWGWFYQSSSWSCPWLCHLGSGAGSQGADLAPFPLACLGGGALALGDWWFCLPWRHLRALWASPTPLIHRIPFCCFFFCVIANTDFLC